MVHSPSGSLYHGAMISEVKWLQFFTRVFIYCNPHNFFLLLKGPFVAPSRAIHHDHWCVGHTHFGVQLIVGVTCFNCFATPWKLINQHFNDMQMNISTNLHLRSWWRWVYIKKTKTHILVFNWLWVSHVLIVLQLLESWSTNISMTCKWIFPQTYT